MASKSEGRMGQFGGWGRRITRGGFWVNVAAVMLIMSLAACGDTTTNTPVPQPTSTAPTTVASIATPAVLSPTTATSPTTKPGGPTASPTSEPTVTAGPTYTPYPTPTLGPTATPAPTYNFGVTERPGYKLAWSDEFNGVAGTAPNPAVWSHEIGDGTSTGNRGWGNNELEYYTDSAQNAALDGAGNLVISARKADPAANLTCYYGPCQYTSARLITARKVELTYGRLEARLKATPGGGTWPAFWALGANIDRVGWPQSGEIDIMEYVGRTPKRIFGTIHGPGYSGAKGFVRTYDLPANLADDWHVFAVDWQPDKIVWSIDNIIYHQANPTNVTPNEWVFNQPFYLILNVAIGGNLGGMVPPDTAFPQVLSVDYVRQYQKNS